MCSRKVTSIVSHGDGEGVGWRQVTAERCPSVDLEQKHDDMSQRGSQRWGSGSDPERLGGRVHRLHDPLDNRQVSVCVTAVAV